MIINELTQIKILWKKDRDAEWKCTSLNDLLISSDVNISKDELIKIALVVFSHFRIPT